MTSEETPMVIVMNEHATEDQVEKVIAALTQKGYDAHRSTGATRTVIGVVGASRTPLDPREFEIMPGVHEVVKITEPYKLAGRTFQPEDTVIRIGGVEIGGRDIVMMAGALPGRIKEWLFTAECVGGGGTRDVMLWERGIWISENYPRNTMDISAIPIIKKLSHLPILADPSHGTGLRDKVIPMARAAVAAGADGIMVEVHHEPEAALSDGPQSIYPEQFAELMAQLRIIAPAIGRTI